MKRKPAAKPKAALPHSEADLHGALLRNLGRFLSPTLIAEYETMLPDKKLLRAKLHEFYQLLAPGGIGNATAAKPRRKQKGGAQ